MKVHELPNEVYLYLILSSSFYQLSVRIVSSRIQCQWRMRDWVVRFLATGFFCYFFARIFNNNILSTLMGMVLCHNMRTTFYPSVVAISNGSVNLRFLLSTAWSDPRSRHGGFTYDVWNTIEIIMVAGLRVFVLKTQRQLYVLPFS